MKNKSVFCLFATFAITAASTASFASAETVPVFIRYRLQALRTAGPTAVSKGLANRIQFKTDLKNTVEQAQAEVFSSMGFTNTDSLKTIWIAGGTVARLSAKQVRELRRHRLVSSVSALGRKGHLTDRTPEVRRMPGLTYTYGLEQIAVPEVRFKHFGLEGNGVRVGVIDTGIDETHPDLRGRVVAYNDFVDSKIKVPRDDHGHGTHVAGTVGGGATSGTAIGVAPKVSFIIAKVFDRSGDSEDTELLAALQWMADPDGDPKTDDAPRVINNSWNVDGDIGKLDSSKEAFCLAIDGLKSLGIVSVFAAGNDGGSRNKIKMPGACPNALTVAATDIGDQVSSFSSRGPAQWQSGVIAKPDVAAPGKDIESAESGGGYGSKSGTSMASPHVAGAVAILVQANPNLTVDEVKSVLMKSSHDIEAKGPDSTAGAGRINLLGAVDAL